MVIATICLIVVALVIGCRRSRADDQLETEVIVTRDIPYAYRDGEFLELDLFRPSPYDEPLPAVILIHGGGFKEGGKRHMAIDAKLGAQRGYITIPIEYRLTEPLSSRSEENRFPAQIHDVKESIRWIRSNAIDYGIDLDRIGAVGFGAGAYLALLAAFTGPRDGLEGGDGTLDVSTLLQAVVAVAGEADLTQANMSSDFVESSMVRYIGARPSELPEVALRASPVNYLSQLERTAVLAIFGARDSRVGVEQAFSLIEAMNWNNARHAVMIVPNAGHSRYQLANPIYSFPIWSFFELYLMQSGPPQIVSK